MSKFAICPLCESDRVVKFSSAYDVEYGTSNTLYTYLRCINCECIYLNDPPVNELDLIYPSNYYSYDDLANLGFLKKQLEKVKVQFDKILFSKILRKLNSNSISILDVGGGSGWMLDILKTMSPKVQSTNIVDLNLKSKLIAESKGHKFYCCKIESLEVIDKYDLILLLNLIEHVANPINVLEKLRSLLKNDGLVVIKTPNTNSLNRIMFRSRYWGGLHAPRHWVLFNKDNFLKAAALSGLEVVSFSFTQGAPQWAASFIGSFSKFDINILKKKPIVERVSYSLLCALFALFDILTLKFIKSDQMIIVLKRTRVKNYLDSK